MNRYEEGTRVSWRWGAYTAKGRIARIFDQDVGTVEEIEAARHAWSREPAYMIEQDDGARVLKNHSELIRLA
jgi:hypothetical protein